MDKTIYKKDSTGKIRYFNIRVANQMGVAGIITWETGVVGTDKPVVGQKEITKGKNRGRANATNPHQQALVEAQSRYNKKLDEGYKEIDEAPNVWPHDLKKFDEFVQMLDNALPDISTDARGYVKPMLAHSYKKGCKFISGKFLLQPKLNGIRALIALDRKKRPQLELFGKSYNFALTSLSRKGKSYDIGMQHILKELFPLVSNLQKLGIEDPVIDGEVYIHGDFVTDVGGLLRKKDRVPEHDRLEYHIFDLAIPDVPQIERLKLLKEALQGLEFKKVFKVDTFYANKEKFLSTHKEYIKQGFEGSILRRITGLYAFDKRSHDLIKHKEYMDKEFEILDIIYDSDRPAQTLRFVLRLKENSNQTFEASAGIPFELRQTWIDNPNLCIGKQATVRFYEYTNDKIPFQPHLRNLRDPEYD